MGRCARATPRAQSPGDAGTKGTPHRCRPRRLWSPGAAPLGGGARAFGARCRRDPGVGEGRALGEEDARSRMDRPRHDPRHPGRRPPALDGGARHSSLLGIEGVARTRAAHRERRKGHLRHRARCARREWVHPRRDSRRSRDPPWREVPVKDQLRLGRAAGPAHVHGQDVLRSIRWPERDLRSRGPLGSQMAAPRFGGSPARALSPLSPGVRADHARRDGTVVRDETRGPAPSSAIARARDGRGHDRGAQGLDAVARAERIGAALLAGASPRPVRLLRHRLASA